MSANKLKKNKKTVITKKKLHNKMEEKSTKNTTETIDQELQQPVVEAPAETTPEPTPTEQPTPDMEEIPEPLPEKEAEPETAKTVTDETMVENLMKEAKPVIEQMATDFKDTVNDQQRIIDEERYNEMVKKFFGEKEVEKQPEQPQPTQDEPTDEETPQRKDENLQKAIDGLDQLLKSIYESPKPQVKKTNIWLIILVVALSLAAISATMLLINQNKQ